MFEEYPWMNRTNIIFYAKSISENWLLHIPENPGVKITSKYLFLGQWNFWKAKYLTFSMGYFLILCV